MNFGYQKLSLMPFGETVDKIKANLAKQGFGVISEIDVRQTFKKKLNIEYDNYLILGACHPQSAFAVLEAEKMLGLMLPCNVIVFEKDAKTFAATILPTKVIGSLQNKNLEKIAAEVEQKLIAVIEQL